MRKIYWLFIFLFSVMKAQVKVIDLSTGRNDDGSVMPIEIEDPDWKCIRPDGSEHVARTRHTYSGWYYPQFKDNTYNERWITGAPGDPGEGYFIYKSKSFVVPKGNKADLEVRSLAYMRQWTYLVKENTNSTETETLLTQTTWMNDGAKGWFNSRSPLAEAELKPGTYHIKVKVYVNSSRARQSLNVASKVYISPSNEKDYTLAPNSYIFDIDKANKENLGGLSIPVKKAFAVWENNKFLDKPIPQGKLFADLQWQDVYGLVEKIEVINSSDSDRENAKINVNIDKRKGKGNAIVALHVGPNGNSSDPIYWSWHIWVTDDPTKNARTNNNNPNGQTRMVSTFMDRNLGALSANFLGNDWTRSGGLMYQWGRKDPYPVFLYLDGYAPEIHLGEKGFVNRWNYGNHMKMERPYETDVNKNIQASIHNPVKFFYPLKKEYTQNWDDSLKIFKATVHNVSWLSNNISVSNNESTLDLWGDNSKGARNSAGWVVAQAQKTPFDPCPSGWKVPSYASRTSYDRYNSSPWGKYPTIGYKGKNNSKLWMEPFGQKLDLIKYKFTNGYEDDTMLPVDKYPGIKIYPSLGYDFSDVPGYDIGAFPLVGHYVGYYGYNPARGLTFQDQNSELALWGATLEQYGYAKRFSLTANALEKGAGKYLLDPEGSGGGTTYNLNAVRCIKQDRADTFLFDTEYLKGKTYYSEGMDNPNTYLLTQSNRIQEVNIPVNKAFSIYNTYLTDGEWPQGELSSNVYWTTNKDLIKTISLYNTTGNKENSQIKVQINPNQSGNAIISVHAGNNRNSKDQVLWSWHIWVTKNEVKINTYTTEKRFSDTKTKLIDYKRFLVYETTSGYKPSTTEFMDRDLGALDANITKTDFVGMHYQWGRKDPIPNFKRNSKENYTLYIGNTVNGRQDYTPMTSDEYDNSDYIGRKEFGSTKEALLFTSRNPLSFIVDSKNTWTPYALLNNGNELWGKAKEKSPFDPCPGGWRVPEGGNIQPASPWYKEGTYYFKGDAFYEKKYKELEGKNISLYIDKEKIINGSGFIFDRPDYKLGMYPAAGFRVVKDNRKSSIENFGIESSLWTASIANWSKSAYSNAHLFYANSSNLNILGFNNIGQGRSVRCVKDTRSVNTFHKAVNNVNEIFTVNDNENLDDSYIQIYPNPNTGLFSINLKDITEGTIQILNINNSVVYSKQFNSSDIEVNIQGQPSGIYIVKIQSGSKIITKKIIKN